MLKSLRVAVGATPFQVWTCCAAVALLAACGTPAPPSAHRVEVRSAIAGAGPMLALVDVCLQKDLVGDDDDHFLAGESQAAGQALLAELTRQLAARAVQPRQAVAPFACGSRIAQPLAGQVKVVLNKGGPIVQGRAPFSVSEELAADAAYVDALGVLGTYAFEGSARLPGSAGSLVGRRIDRETFLSAAQVLRSRSGADAALVLVVIGSSQSAGKATAHALGSFLTGFGTALLTAGLGTGFAVGVIPGRPVDGRLMHAALVDLVSGDLRWSSTLRAPGDPVLPEVVAEPKALSTLLKGAFFEPVRAEGGKR